MACVNPRGNRWQAIFIDSNGKEVRKSTGIEINPKVIPPGESLKSIKAVNKEKATLIAREMESIAKGRKPNLELIEAIGGDLDKITLGQNPKISTNRFMRNFLQAREGKKGAMERDRRAIDRFLSFLGESKDIPISKVTKAMATDFMETELERVKSGTVERYLSTLSCAFNRAVDERIIDSNPFRGVIPPKTARYDKQERKAFSIEQVKRMIANFPPEWGDMIQVCLYTGGQRLGDVATLGWDQVDLDNGTIAMTTEKTKRRMMKPIIEPLRKILEKRKDQSVSEYVFPIAKMNHSRAGSKSSKLSLEFGRLLEEEGILKSKERAESEGDRRELSELSFHSLRATAVTVLRLAGVSNDLCRHLVGHDSEAIEREYIRPQVADEIEALNKIGDQLKDK